MVDIPQSKEDITLRHTIVHYTFLPMVVLVFIAIVSSLVLWVLGHASFGWAIVFPWIVLYGAMIYIWLLGDYVIPRETYINLRNGKWDNSDSQ